MLPSTTNHLDVATNGNLDTVVILATSDRVPGMWFLFDQSKGKLLKLGATMPDIDPKTQATLEPVHYAARDGLDIPAWLTVPAGAERKNLPLVVLVHGGPNVRGRSWDWDPETQFLASRGYAVLEPEFRGSTGYGWKLFHAGWKQWGLAMQDDVADGVRWAVAQGIVDPRRVCIAGASYGGYSVLMGLARDPDLYRCGIDWVGVTDINLMYTADWSDMSNAWKQYGMPLLVGDPVTDAAQLKATSPVNIAAKIHAPLLMAYGGKDKRVPIEHGERFHAALERQPGAKVEWVVYDKEGHGWRATQTQIDFWNRVARFLDANIGKP
jgi:dipeptidyl aminopeptidase/acylaminoacyl peptidase